MEECIFCRIAKKEMEAETVYEDERIIAFRDINPAAKVHVLIIPKQHMEGIAEIASADGLAGEIMETANKIAGQEKINASGFRLLVNSGADAGQVVNHLHFHLLGGERLKRI